MNSNQVANLPNDSPTMRTTLQALGHQRIYYERKSQFELHVRNLSFYPDRGYIYPDGVRLPLPKPHRGLPALLRLLRGPHHEYTFISPTPPASTNGQGGQPTSWSVPPAIAEFLPKPPEGITLEGFCKTDSELTESELPPEGITLEGFCKTDSQPNHGQPLAVPTSHPRSPKRSRLCP
jgi:hypothetical protein